MAASVSASGIMLQCDVDGRILRVIRDELGLFEVASPLHLLDLVDASSLDKAQRFLGVLRDEHAAFSWEINFRQGQEVRGLFLAGGESDGSLFICGSPSREGVSRLSEELMQINNQHLNSLRSAVKAQVQRQSGVDDRERELLTQLTDLNNELVNTQRELARRNAELLRARQTLEEQHLQLQAANDRLTQLAATDGLTGVGNHRAFQERLVVELTIARRQGAPLSLLLVDIDHFKRLNDTQGHPTGDEILRSFAGLLRDRARAGDFVARYGGEEFAILCPGSDERQSHTFAERLRQAIEEAPWSLGQVTASFGVATTDGDVATRTELLGAADNALYQSKRDGRNRVTHACQMQTTVGAV